MADPNRPLWQWSACELADAIAARKVTVTEAVGSAVMRMRATNGKINAVVDDLGDSALREAEAHDKAISAGGPIGPLHGVPVTIKENVDQKGCATPNGVVAFKDVIAPDDAPVVRNLRRAGAIINGQVLANLALAYRDAGRAVDADKAARHACERDRRFCS